MRRSVRGKIRHNSLRWALIDSFHSPLRGSLSAVCLTSFGCVFPSHSALHLKGGHYGFRNDEIIELIRLRTSTKPI